MAIARCEKHTPIGVMHDYHVFALPVGHPDTAAICGRSKCLTPARVWLSQTDRLAHQQGQRIFGIQTEGAKLRVCDALFCE